MYAHGRHGHDELRTASSSYLKVNRRCKADRQTVKGETADSKEGGL